VIGTFAAVRDDAQFAIQGGGIDASKQPGKRVLFAAAERSILSLTGVKLSSDTSLGAIAIQAQDTSVVTLNGSSTVTGFGTVCRLHAEGTTLHLDEVQANGNDYVVYAEGNQSNKSTIRVTKLNATNGKQVIFVPSGEFDLSIVDSYFSSNNDGVFWNAIGSISIETSKINKNLYGVRALTTKAFTARLRNVEIAENSDVGLQLNGVLLGNYNLGTLESPGNNIFVNNGPTSTTGGNLTVTGSSSIVVYAVGNTWNDSVQGADGAGHYVASGAEHVLEVTGGSGPNYRLSVPTVARLAEIP
jgi:hypothetical protein